MNCSPRGVSEAVSASAGGSSWVICRASEAGLLPENAFFPVIIS